MEFSPQVFGPYHLALLPRAVRAARNLGRGECSQSTLPAVRQGRVKKEKVDGVAVRVRTSVPGSCSTRGGLTVSRVRQPIQERHDDALDERRVEQAIRRTSDDERRERPAAKAGTA